MNDSQIKSVALFFLFIFFNEQKALQLTSRTLRLAQRKLRSRDNQMSTEALLISLTQKILSKKEKTFIDQFPVYIAEAFQLPDDVSVESLINLRRQTSIDEYSTLVWTKLIGLDDETVAIGTHSSLGTVRHRIAISLKTLSESPKVGTENA